MPLCLPNAYRSTCVRACPLHSPNAYRSACVRACPLYSLNDYRSACVRACPLYSPNDYRSARVRACPLYSPKAYRCLCVRAVPLLKAEQKCHPDSKGVRRFNGRPCASTTRYDDGHRGSCGCGPAGSDTPYSWNLQKYVTAPSQKYFDRGGDSTWCGASCGRCVRLTPTGELIGIGIPFGFGRLVG